MENISKKISLLGMAGITIYLYYQFAFNESMQDAMSNVVIVVLLYNCLLIIGGNIKHRRSSKADIALCFIAFVMASAGTYWWLQIKGFI
ncbi:hypothetical protein [Sporomusa sphaeroides]|uniref:Uncharacterized protein n=1 Tax=Sporomusa sphaeroides DSM 2875 TaxID=1337886 RepID=A0A1U7MA17_9FIRM|nr:hypothetical protein [Sporomusa sphaeroides]OLS54348.1 hypothetical protein SPSPH_45940 [Sporomusa sphaeroides DSM 2875]CVK21644.1 hypothetical protein SSPH_04339 [Sporomusa sphaeroides DSM 2875]